MTDRERTNVAKRQDIMWLTGRAVEAGWSRKDLSILLGITPGAVGRYLKGTSMGTNAHRETLRNLPPRESPAALQALVKAVEAQTTICTRWAARAEDWANQCEAEGKPDWAARKRAEAERRRKDIAGLERYLKGLA